MKYLRLLIGTFGFCILFPGCSNKLMVADELFIEKNMPYIRDGNMTRQDVLLKLGEPNWSFENGRILTYRIMIDKKGRVTPVTNDNNKSARDLSANTLVTARHYSLVLVFNALGILEKHSLVLTNP